MTSTESPKPCDPLTGGTQTLAYLTDVRLGTHEGYDRITFQFDPAKDAPKGLPTYEIRSANGPFTRDPSDEKFEIRGPYYAVVIFHGGTGVEISGETPIEHYKGPKEFKSSLEVLVEAEEAGDFEATLQWVMGTSRPSCPKATVLEDPTRLAIDFPH